MKKLKITAGIIWAFLCLVLIIALFPGLTGLSRSLAGLPFMKINPNYSGGEEAYREISQACTLVVHRPVFDGLIRERNKGFVQVDWKGTVPDRIKDTIDYDRNGKPDFIADINTKSNSALVIPVSINVKGLNLSTRTSYGWTIRISLIR